VAQFGCGTPITPKLTDQNSGLGNCHLARGVHQLVGFGLNTGLLWYLYRMERQQ